MLAGILILGGAYAYISYFFLPQWAHLQSLNGALQKREAYYQKIKDYQSNRPQLLKEAQSLEVQMKQLNSQMPGKLDKAQILVDLYGLAKQEGVNPQSLTFDAVQNKGSYEEAGMSFVSNGSPAAVLNMINALQHGSSHRLAVRGVNLTMQKGLMKAELKLTAYSNENLKTITANQLPFMKTPFGVDSAAKMFTP